MWNQEVYDLAGSIRNRCDLIEYIAETGEFHRCLATLCEDVFEDAQALIDDWCVLDNDGWPITDVTDVANRP